MHQIVEDILAAQQREHEFDLYIQEEMGRLPACDGVKHSEAVNGHQPDQPAQFLVVSPCGFARMRCNGWLTALLLGSDFLLCNYGGCGEKHRVADLTYTSLDVSRG